MAAAHARILIRIPHLIEILERHGVFTFKTFIGFARGNFADVSKNVDFANCTNCLTIILKSVFVIYAIGVIEVFVINFNVVFILSSHLHKKTSQSSNLHLLLLLFTHCCLCTGGPDSL